MHILSVTQSILMYHSVLKVKKNAGLRFSKLSFKVESACMLLYKVVTFVYTKSSDMLNKNTWGVKKCGANQNCKQAGANKKFDIS